MASLVELSVVEHVAGSRSPEIHQVVVVAGLRARVLALAGLRARVLVVAGLNLLANKPRREHSIFI